MTRPIVLVGSKGRRTDSMIEAARRLGHETPVLLDYETLLRGTPRLPAGAWVRMDAPDEDRDALVACYEAGADATTLQSRAPLTGQALTTALDTPGWIGQPTQLALGLGVAATRLERLVGSHGARLSVDHAGVSLAYDKTACAAHLRNAGVTVPKALPAPTCFDDLIASMDAERCSRVYVKPQHGAGGGGAVALALGPRGELVGYTGVELEGKTPRQTKRMRRITDRSFLARIIDALAPLGLHAEAWLPKISLGGRVCDLRVVMIRGQAPCAVLRSGRHTMTNLHLDAERDHADALKNTMGNAAWSDLIATAHKTFDCFPGLHMAGLDIAVLREGRRHAVLEVNAFGDHIRKMTFNGHTLQELQLAEAMKGLDHAA